MLNRHFRRGAETFINRGPTPLAGRASQSEIEKCDLIAGRNSHQTAPPGCGRAET